MKIGKPGKPKFISTCPLDIFKANEQNGYIQSISKFKIHENQNSTPAQLAHAKQDIFKMNAKYKCVKTRKIFRTYRKKRVRNK